MASSKTLTTALSLVCAGLLTTACAIETPDGTSPDVDDTGLDVRASDGFNQGGTLQSTDPSSSGWTLLPTVAVDMQGTYPNLIQVVKPKATFSRTSGASTRGGGSCLVKYKGSATCTTDASCTTLYGAPPAGGYNYCAALDGGPKRCYQRPGSDTAWCYKFPFNAPGSYTGSTWNVWPSSNTLYSLGCLADAGCDTACGITDPADACFGKYKRSLKSMSPL